MNKIRLILVVFFVLFLAVSTVHASPFTELAAQSKFSLGVGYSYYAGKWGSSDANWREIKFISNQPYVQAGYEMKDFEAYLRLGTADLKIGNVFASGSGVFGSKQDFYGSMKPFATAGIKYSLKYPSFGISPFLQVNLYSSYKDSTSGTIFGFSATQEVEIKNPREVNLGVAFQSKVRGVNLYAGPVVGRSEASVESKLIVSGVGTAANSTTYREKNNYGIFAGLQAPLGKKFALEVQGRMKSEFSGGIALIHKF